MALFTIHHLFDLLAILAAVTSGIVAVRWKLYPALEKTTRKLGPGYFLALSSGSLLGSFMLGTLNLYLSGEAIVGRSILGAVIGATLTVEIYKLIRKTRGSTGFIYVIPFCLLVIVGRLGCFFAGLEDHTFGIETHLPWGVDFGDQQLRHPVQLYESLAMLFFLVFVVIALAVQSDLIIGYGYYLCVGFYGAQRFFWEFLKPYAELVGPFNIFHFASAFLIIYCIFMCQGVRRGYRIT